MNLTCLRATTVDESSSTRSMDHLFACNKGGRRRTWLNEETNLSCWRWTKPYFVNEEMNEGVYLTQWRDRPWRDCLRATNVWTKPYVPQGITGLDATKVDEDVYLTQWRDCFEGEADEVKDQADGLYLLYISKDDITYSSNVLVDKIQQSSRRWLLLINNNEENITDSSNTWWPDDKVQRRTCKTCFIEIKHALDISV